MDGFGFRIFGFRVYGLVLRDWGLGFRIHVAAPSLLVWFTVWIHVEAPRIAVLGKQARVSSK